MHRADAAALQFDAAGESGRPRRRRRRTDIPTRRPSPGFAYIGGLEHCLRHGLRRYEASPRPTRIRLQRAGQPDGSLPPASAISGRPPPFPPTACATAPASFPGVNLRRQILRDAGDDGDIRILRRREHHHRALPLVAQRIHQRAELLPIETRSPAPPEPSTPFTSRACDSSSRRLRLRHFDFSICCSSCSSAFSRATSFSICSTRSDSGARTAPATRASSACDVLKALQRAFAR